MATAPCCDSIRSPKLASLTLADGNLPPDKVLIDIGDWNTAVDAAVVVCEADEKKVPQLQLIMRELEDQNIPRFVFLNKIDKADKRVRETIKLLQPASRVPLLLRQIPIWNGDIISGFVDLAIQRALRLLQNEFEARTWQSFWRAAVDGLSTAEVAAEMGMTVSAVRMARSRILRRLREELGDLVG